MKRYLFFIFFIIILSSLALAHQPRIPTQDYTIVNNPTISQAFYTELQGNEHYYEISSEEPFTLYVSLLVPLLENIETDLTLEVLHNEEIILTLNGLEYEWTEYYEEHAGDYYLEGPDEELEVEPGTYIVTISSGDNQGKYVFVTGKEESFPFNEILKTVIIMPKLKMYFNKSPLQAYTTPTMLLFLLPVLTIIALITLAVYFLVKRK
ncbi:MAG: hypothetical protein ABIF40_02280 [archaeon]